jgi:nicotinate phosphoribosyltransferase
LLAHDAPVDSFGVGTKLVTGYMPPGFVFKLVAIEDGATMRSVAKRSIGKLSTGGAKDAYRLFVDGVATTELVVPRDSLVTGDPANSRALTHPLVERGRAVVTTSPDTARRTMREAIAELPERAFALSAGESVLVTEVIDDATPTRPLP